MDSQQVDEFLRLSDEVRSIRQQLAELEHQLRIKLAEIGRLTAGLAPKEPKEPKELTRPLPFPSSEVVLDEKLRAGKGGIRERVHRLFELNPSRTFTTKKINKYVPVSNLNTIRAILARLHEEELIVRTGVGNYRLRMDEV